ncbi:tetratricopeptide repeat protein [Pseudosporangium ferrugineum]|uniref:Tetratricopeptide repeat protein n=1 Tax=Pseudosporangium ferrugineum TaxID=439699 RepID=A0A2T0SFN2_9ACTN|nr:tetratricopeptide repeat protein [Pseudosporangium ferrugineum]PRY32220.1 tetratricopeptide repeat protein [Pseudosporangium ferrugineum]
MHRLARTSALVVTAAALVFTAGAVLGPPEPTTPAPALADAQAIASDRRTGPASEVRHGTASAGRPDPAPGAGQGGRPGAGSHGPAAGSDGRAAGGSNAGPGAGPDAPIGPDRAGETIARAQRRLRDLPKDYRTWAELGLAYVERARVTADPALYPKAEGALRRSLAVRPRGNPEALTGLGALANARHDFAAARDRARAALRDNPWSADAYGVLADAHTQLGDAAAATRAVQRMLDLRPGLAAYARASYDLEQRGDLAGATALMRRALDAATDPADVAFCRNQLGDLAWASGDPRAAGAEYAAGLAAAPSYQPLLRGRSRVAAATGNLTAALTDAATVAARTPTPDSLMEYATLLRLAGRTDEAERQLTLADAAHRLFEAGGGRDDLTGALLALARGDAPAAVRLARAEYARRPFADVADTLGLALHTAGQDRQALPYARRAVTAGPRNAAYAYHLALISLGTGDLPTAREQLRRVRALNPYFSPVDGPTAARALAATEAQP